MSDQPRSSRRGRLAEVFAWLAVVPVTALNLWWLVLFLTLPSDERIFLLNPVVFIIYTAAIWTALAVAAMMLARGQERRRATVLAAVALAEVAVGLAVAVIS